MRREARVFQGDTCVARSRTRRYLTGGAIAAGLWFAMMSAGHPNAQAVGPTLVDPNLAVNTVVTGLTTPTTMAFIGPNDILVLEKNTGKVQRVINGILQMSPVLDLAVNFGSERGLLGIALHPRFPRNPGVYLYWTESTARDATGALVDSNVLANTPLLGNRVDRFVWNGSTLTFERNLIRLRALQQDDTNATPTNPRGERGNHNGGVIRFELMRDDDEDEDEGTSDGEDEERKARLFIIIGDNGRRGNTQNLINGPFGPGIPDDQFGGPAPDNAHLTGVVLRLNDDGTTPRQNPFFRLGRRMGGVVGANIQKIFAYGVRNSFGLAVDPFTGNLWNEENGDDSFDEINRITSGQNNGWVQIMGPVSRVAQFKAIETSPQFSGLQQVRWPPSNIADTPQEALSRLVMLKGAHYRDPLFAWKFAIAPAGIGFLSGRGLGPDYVGDLFVGSAVPNPSPTQLQDQLRGTLLRFKLTRNRRSLAFSDPRLADGVADNKENTKFDPTESETLLFGRGFGVGTDIVTGPNGNLFVVSLNQGAIYEIHRR